MVQIHSPRPFFQPLTTESSLYCRSRGSHSYRIHYGASRFSALSFDNVFMQKESVIGKLLDGYWPRELLVVEVTGCADRLKKRAWATT
jgi:hypothetical protein